jgi:hypothetical protein
MDTLVIIVLMTLAIVFLLLFCLGSLMMMNKFLVIKHDIRVVMDENKNVSVEAEKFGVVSDIVLENKENEKFKIIDKCENKSLNEIHKTGDEIIKPSQIMGDAKTQDEIGEGKYYKKFNPPKMYEQLPGVLGSNYMNFNDNPDPYHLDFTLYDKDAPQNNPVGVNYQF